MNIVPFSLTPRLFPASFTVRSLLVRQMVGDERNRTGILADRANSSSDYTALVPVNLLSGLEFRTAFFEQLLLPSKNRSRQIENMFSSDSNWAAELRRGSHSVCMYGVRECEAQREECVKRNASGAGFGFLPATALTTTTDVPCFRMMLNGVHEAGKGQLSQA